MENKLIAITGGIGSGKSTALNIIKELGFNVISCDQITNELYLDQAILRKLKKIFPTAIEGEKELKADRKKISKECFSDSEKHKLLTEIMTKEIFRLAILKAKSLEGKVFIEVPLLFENQYQKEFDSVIVVKRDINARIDAVKHRSNLTEKEIKERIKNQVDYDKLDLKTFNVITNDGNIEKLKENIIKAINNI